MVALAEDLFSRQGMKEGKVRPRSGKRDRPGDVARDHDGIAIRNHGTPVLFEHKLKIADRAKYNQAIINKLQELINKYPDLRFCQLLVNCDIIQYKPDVLCDGQRECLLLIDPFYDESELTYERMLKSKICSD